jgi:dipeptidyl aminopeptidase/acylaminoacyl peptidase
VNSPELEEVLVSRSRVVLGCFILAFPLGVLLAGQVSRAQTGNARQLSFPPAGYTDTNCSFSPKGDRVVIARSPLGAAWLTELYVVDVSTGAETVLVTGLPTTWNPNAGFEWSPDGSHIAFGVDRPGMGHAIWIVDVPTGRGRP